MGTTESKAPQISVIMSVYNQGAHVGEAIESILKQSFSDFEFIIINDGSDDGSSSIIRRYSDPRIVFYDFPANEGLVKRLNYGLSIAKGEYIARMDSDDISLPERFKVQAEFLEQHPEYAVCGTFCDMIDYRGNLIGPSWVNKATHEEIKIMLLLLCPICHPTVMIRREVLSKHAIWYSMEYEHCEDYRMWYEISKVAKLANIPAVLHNYRVHDFQITRTKNKMQLQNTVKSIRDQLYDLGIVPTDGELKIHMRISGSDCHEHDFNPDPDEVIAWLNKLKEANDATRVYDSAIFNGMYQTVVHEIDREKREASA